MRTETINVYKFNELSEQAKQKAIEDYRNLERDFSWLPDDIKEELLQDDRFERVENIVYSLSYCQGDGLSFSCDGFSDETLLKAFNSVLGEGKERCARVLVDEFGWMFKTRHNNGNYCYASNSDVVKYDGAWHHDNIEGVLDEVRDYLAEEVYLPKCRELESYGYSLIEYEDSDECIIESLEINGWEFLESGEFY